MKYLLSLLFLVAVTLLPASAQDNLPLKILEDKSSPHPAEAKNKVQGYGTSHVSYDFGAVELMNINELENKLRRDKEKGILRLGEVDQSFILQNKSKRPISIVNVYSDPPCAVGQFAGKSNFILDPVLAPGQQARVFVSFKPTMVSPGPIETNIIFLAEDQKEVAIVSMHGVVKGGIQVAPSRLDFGAVDFGTTQSRTFDIRLDRRMAGRLPPGGRVHLLSSNPYVTIDSVSAVGANPGLIFNKDGWRAKNINQNEFKNDVTLRAKVSLKGSAPLGYIKARIELTTPGFPLWMIVSEVGTDVLGKVVGHMKVPSHVVGFGEVEAGQEMKKRVNIECLAPVTPESLRFSSSSKDLILRRIIPTKAVQDSALNHRQVTLEIIQSAQSPLGQRNNIITITNTLNNERLEVRTYATITKAE